MSKITWACGLTTVPQRMHDGLLDRTLTSLKAGGFTDIRLFIDGLSYPMSWDSPFKTLPMTCRNPSIRVYGNFHLGLSELFIRNPKADLYAMFQDDFVTYKNLRAYLERCKFPEKGYFNLYTFPQNQKKFEGWYPSNQLGKGAVALVLPRAAVLALLSSSYWTLRPTSNPENPDRIWKFIDGGIVEALKRDGFKEYVHNPSLVQHTGIESVAGNKKQDLAESFKGEQFNALELLRPSELYEEVRVVPKRKLIIGLVGYNVASGLGELNRQIAEYAGIKSWMIKPHPNYPSADLPDIDFDVCDCNKKLEKWVKSVEVVVFAERPYYTELLDLCRKHRRRTVCIPMMEWMPPGAKGWPQEVDLFICPTKQCYEQFAHVVPCVYFPWPVDTRRFKFKQRTVCEKFIFINGHGGYHGRKGGAVLDEVLSQWPDLPLVVYDQSGHYKNALPAPKNNADLYTQGDVLICPHSVDGLGLEPMEAMASGVPVITTRGQPWMELPALARILCKETKRTVRRPVTWYVLSPTHLRETCRNWLGKDISLQSEKAGEWASSRSWESLAERFVELVCWGKVAR